MKLGSRLFALLLVAVVSAAAQTGFQSRSYAAPGSTMIPADFNGDGAPDLLFWGQNNAVMLNDGHGGFGAAQSISVGTTSAVAIGDVNGDGKPDLAYCVGTGAGPYTLAVFLNDGGGNFHQSWTDTVTGVCTGVAIGNANKDGKADLSVTTYVPNSTTGVNDNSVLTYPGDGTGMFGAAIVQTNLNLDGTLYQGDSVPADQCSIGDTVGYDFTGDGVLDLVVTANCPGGPINEGTLWLAKGDGTGHYTFTEIAQANYGYDGEYPKLVDANHDGKMDVALVDQQSGPHGSEDYHSALLINQGNGAMTYIQTFDQNAYAGLGGYMYSASGADFNNDGLADSVAGFSRVAGDGTTSNNVAIIEAKSGGGYSVSQQWTVTDIVTDVVAADFDNNGSPDIAVVTRASADGPYRLIVYLNEASGSSSCHAPSSPGAVLCTPKAGQTYSSPVQVTGAGTGASGSVNHLELWIDGQKIGNYPGNTVSTSVSLGNGPHTATLVEVDSSAHYLKSTPVTFTVGNSGGGGGSCTPPSAAGATLCSPAPGSTVSSPVQFSGAGKAASGSVNHLELWVDGKKIGNYPGSTMTASVALASGQHAATLVEVDSSGKYLKSNPVSFTVR